MMGEGDLACADRLAAAQQSGCTRAVMGGAKGRCEGDCGGLARDGSRDARGGRGRHQGVLRKSQEAGGNWWASPTKY